jgi:hypothetical protein
MHAVGQQSTVRRLFTAVAMQHNNGSDQRFFFAVRSGNDVIATIEES